MITQSGCLVEDQLKTGVYLLLVAACFYRLMISLMHARVLISELFLENCADMTCSCSCAITFRKYRNLASQYQLPHFVHCSCYNDIHNTSLLSYVNSAGEEDIITQPILKTVFTSQE